MTTIPCNRCQYPTFVSELRMGLCEQCLEETGLGNALKDAKTKMAERNRPQPTEPPEVAFVREMEQIADTMTECIHCKWYSLTNGVANCSVGSCEDIAVAYDAWLAAKGAET